MGKEEVKLTVPELMKVAGDLYKKKNKDYGDSYKIYGEVMEAMFPKGISFNTKSDFNKFGVLSMLVTKLIRYSNLFATGTIAESEPTKDTVIDFGVYSFMLLELEEEA